MYRYACVAVVLILGCGIPLFQTTDVSILDKDNKTCMYNNMMVNFTVLYNVNGTNSTANFVLPETVNTTGSKCGEKSSVMILHFGNGHSWSIHFIRNNDTYKSDNITFTYNLNDPKIFPNATETGYRTVENEYKMKGIPINHYYKCMSNDKLVKDGVTQTFWNVTSQAFIKNGELSQNVTVCDADIPSTTVPPTTNGTTPGTNATTAAPTTTPPPLPNPETHTYNVSNANNSVCLMATMGMRVSYNYHGKEFQINIEPNRTTAGGKCAESNVSSLTLNDSNGVVINFTFIKSDSKNFFLQEVSVQIKVDVSETFKQTNNTLRYWEASLGSSYMCNKMQAYPITANLSLTALDLRVQPFNLENDKYATAEECFLDSDLSFLVPIAVGVALGFLIILVLISYLIGRRKSRTGYQSV
ncbi:lysosome-associated membrane glycoprotein 2 isoform X2 [Amia ocellicauda]|uniref:lysosome-associated membrane glycoprotein 2 isoform X2 n=1 Tax=Amia ocellicauda TaxID=2972642 RepID=UPI0034644CCC